MYEHNKDASAVLQIIIIISRSHWRKKKQNKGIFFEMFGTNGVNYLSECLIQFQVKMRLVVSQNTTTWSLGITIEQK